MSRGSPRLPSGYGTPPEVIAPNPGRATVRRAPGGVLLPWGVSLVVLVLLGVGTGTLLHRGPPDDVPPAVVEARTSVVHATAQAMRKGLDEASDDLAVLADTAAVLPEEDWDRLFQDFLEVHPRYQVVYLVGQDREPQHVVGGARPRAALLPDPLPTAPGLTAPRPARNLPALLAYAPLRRADALPLLLVGRYDVAFFGPALRQTAPGTAYVVDAGDLVVGSTAGFRSFQELPGRVLQAAAQRAAEGEPSGGFLSPGGVVSYAPIRGDSPAGRLGLKVLSFVDRDDLALPRNDARRLAVLLGSLTVLFALLTLFWMYLFVIRPVRRVAVLAERLAFGDRAEPVHVVRYDEIGLVTRALERCRVLLQSPGRER